VAARSGSSRPSPHPRSPRWIRLGSLPVAIAVFVFTNGLYMLLVAFGNITDFATNQAFVHHVLEMDTTNFGAAQGTDLDPDVMWRAVTDTPLQNAGYVAIIVWEALAGIILSTAFVLWIRERGTTFTRARALSSIGLLMIVVLFVGGFIDIGGEWFQMWRSTAWNGLDTAFRTIVLAALPLVLIHLPSPLWTRGYKSR
jgi:predicted small integral membrane protein